MAATLSGRVEQVSASARRVESLSEEFARAAVELLELWDHPTVQETYRAALRAQDAASEAKASVARLEEVA